MRTTLIFAIGALLGISCTHPKNESIESHDSTITVVDSVVTIVQPPVEVETEVVKVTQRIMQSGELVNENGDTVFVSNNQFSFISDPYDFSLDAATIEGLLGNGAHTKSKSFEAGEDYSAYTYSTVTCGETEISFYDFAGKHFSDIRTPLLPLKYGIKVGMKKNDFLDAIGFDPTEALAANKYRLRDDYGEIDFYFRADSLYRIYAHYEEGD